MQAARFLFPIAFTILTTASNANAQCLICPAPSAFELGVFNLINGERTSRGLAAVTMDKRLAVAAARHTDDMLANCFFDHTGSDDSLPWHRTSDAGYPAAGAGEIIAAGHTTPQDVVNGWMNSPGHRAAILCASCTHAGVSYVSGTCFLTPSMPRQRRLWTVNFGRSAEAPETGCDPEVCLLGDFDTDGDVDGGDVDFYIGRLDQPATGDLAQLDLDGDGTVTIADHNLHVTTLVVTSNGVTGALVGDVDLDGVVDVLSDAFALIGSLCQSVTSRSEGDLNADGVGTVLGDAFILISQLGQSN